MKVAILGDYPVDPGRISGGVEAAISYLVDELRRFEGLDLHVVTLRENVRQRLARRSGNVTLHYLPAAYRLANVTFFVVNKVRLLRELHAIRPDLIHAHIAGTYAQVAYATGLPTILTPHGIRHRSEWPGDRWLDRLVRRPLTAREERASVRRAHHLIAISPYIQEEFGHLIRATVYPIENPIPVKFFELQNQEVPGRILYAGRVTDGKSVHHLVQALAYVRGRVPLVQLRVAGGANGDRCQQVIQDMATSMHLDGTVQWLGHLEENSLLREYRECALLVLPSRQETAPMVIQQAMAAGKAVVATRVGGIPYLVSHGETGLLVEHGDVAGLGKAIADLLSNDALRARLGEQAKKEATARFRAGAVAQQTYDVYRKVLVERG